MLTRPRGWRRIGWPVLAAAAATGVAAAALVSASTVDPTPGMAGLLPTWLVVMAALAGLTLAAGAWLTVAVRPGVAIGLAVVTAGLLIPTWATWTWLPPLARAWVLAIAPLAIAGAGQVGLAWQPDRYPRRIVRVGYLLAGAAVTILLVGYDPFHDPGCWFTCPDATLAEGWGRFTHPSFLLAGGLAVLDASVMAPWLLRRSVRWRSGGVPLAALAAASLLAASWVVRAVRWTDPLPTQVVVSLSVAGTGLLGLTTFAAALGLQRTRRAVARIVDRISADRGLPTTDGALRFAMPDGVSWADAAGVASPAPGGAVEHVVISDRSGPVARLRVPPGQDPDDVLAGLTPATLLALRNGQLAAATRWRLAEVQASRRRVVQAADAERQRIERDLHDGAQQHLVSAAFHLSLARLDRTEPDAELTRIDVLLSDTLASLRRIGHGIFPAVLTTEGLRAALDDLGSDSPIPVTIQVPDLALTTEASIAAYAAVHAVVVQARAQPAVCEVLVTAERDAGWATVSVTTLGGAGLDAARVLDIEDRVAAVGGRVSQRLDVHGAHLDAVVPCAS